MPISRLAHKPFGMSANNPDADFKSEISVCGGKGVGQTIFWWFKSLQEQSRYSHDLAGDATV